MNDKAKNLFPLCAFMTFRRENVNFTFTYTFTAICFVIVKKSNAFRSKEGCFCLWTCSRVADKSLAIAGRKQSNVSVRMEWISFGALPCLALQETKILMTARVSMLLKSRASLTCFRACFLPGWAKDLSAPRVMTHFAQATIRRPLTTGCWVRIQASLLEVFLWGSRVPPVIITPSMLHYHLRIFTLTFLTTTNAVP